MTRAQRPSGSASHVNAFNGLGACTHFDNVASDGPTRRHNTADHRGPVVDVTQFACRKRLGTITFCLPSRLLSFSAARNAHDRPPRTECHPGVEENNFAGSRAKCDRQLAAERITVKGHRGVSSPSISAIRLEMMSLKSDDPFKEGFLWLPPHGVLSQLKKSWQKRYCRLFKWSKHGIDRLEVFDSIEDQKLSTIASDPIFILSLESCVKITQNAQKNQSNVFAVWTKTDVHYFSANSEHEMTDWICALQAVAFRDNISNQTIEEDNDLYCSSGDTGVFSVKLISSDASERCRLKEQYYTLEITPDALQLRESDENNTLLLTWPYQFIRRYGYKAGRLFTFEAGRKCESGEGVFHLEHSNQQEIFRCISSKMKSMKKRKESGIMCGDPQFQAALSMGARSRSPLPPSPFSMSPLILDGDLNGFSLSSKPHMSLPLLPVPPTEAPPPLPLKPKPKTIFPMKQPSPFVHEPHCEIKDLELSDAAYEDVQVRNDAWKTMGLNDSSHCEKPYAINSVTSDDGVDNYDHLKDFGYVRETAPGYRKIYPISSTIKQKPLVKVDTEMLPARKADDSHYGYGVINKKNSVEENRSNKESLNSVAHNELQYAMIIKPNKV